MAQLIKRVVITCMLLLLGTGAAAAAAPLKVGVIDTAQVLPADPALDYISAQLKKKNEQLQSAFAAAMAGARSQDAQKQVQNDFKNLVARARADLVSQLWNDVQHAIGEVARQHSVGLVTTKEGVYYTASEPVDLTQPVIAYLKDAYEDKADAAPLHPEAPDPTPDTPLAGVGVIDGNTALASDPALPDLQKQIQGAADQEAQARVIDQVLHHLKDASATVAKSASLQAIVETHGLLYSAGAPERDVTGDVSSALQATAAK